MSIPVIPKIVFTPGMNTSRTEVTAGARTPITAGFPAEANPTKGFPGARLINVNKDVQNPNESSAQLLAN